MSLPGSLIVVRHSFTACKPDTSGQQSYKKNEQIVLVKIPGDGGGRKAIEQKYEGEIEHFLETTGIGRMITDPGILFSSDNKVEYIEFRKERSRRLLNEHGRGRIRFFT